MRRITIERQNDYLTDLPRRLARAVDSILEDGLSRSPDGSWQVLLAGQPEIQSADEYPLLVRILEEQPEVDAVERIDGELHLDLDPAHCRNLHPEAEQIGEDDFRLMAARHMLWLHDQPGGEQADFTGMNLSEVNLSNMVMNNAIFTGTNLKGCSMDDGEFCFAAFAGACLDGIRAERAIFEEADFTGASLRGANLRRSHFDGSRFADANLYGADVCHAHMRNCHMTGAHLEKVNTEAAVTGNWDFEVDSEPDIGMHMQ